MIRSEIHGAHIRPACTERRQEWHVVSEGALAEKLGQDVLEGAVAAVDDKEVDLLASEFGECLGHDAGILGLDVEHIGMASQEAEHPADLFLALARTKIVYDTDSQAGPNL
jgi:hypothetical protein